jgi:hypothetical protein
LFGDGNIPVTFPGDDCFKLKKQPHSSLPQA